MQRRCQVRNCRFARTHVTSGHRCGQCGAYGHGMVECRNRALRDGLARRTSPYHDLMPPNDRCAVVGCARPETHSTEAHHCDECGGRSGRHTQTCGERRCPMCRKTSYVDTNCIVYTDAACSVCMEAAPLVVFPTCRHACVCVACCQKMAASAAPPPPSPPPPPHSPPVLVLPPGPNPAYESDEEGGEEEEGEEEEGEDDDDETVEEDQDEDRDDSNDNGEQEEGHVDIELDPPEFWGLQGSGRMGGASQVEDRL